MQRALPLLFVTLWFGCGPGLLKPDAQEDSSSDASTAASTLAPTSTSGAGGSASDPSTTTSTGESETGTSSSTSAPPVTSVGFIMPPDMGPVPDACDGFMQDCPPGQKCMPYADDGGSSWTNTRCVPVADDPVGVGEPCSAPDGGLSGVDNCELGAMCWDVDAEGNGICVAMCGGTDWEPICPPMHWCASFSRGGALAGICIPNCDPLKQDCDPGDVCIGNPSGEGFLCVLDASGEEGQAHDPCMFANACDPGLICNDPTAAVECDQDAIGCCEPLCDLSKPNSCPGMGQVCEPYYEEGTAPPGLEDVGYCTASP